MAVSDHNNKCDEKEGPIDVELSSIRRTRENPSSQPTAPLLQRSSWVETFGLWKQRSFRQHNNGENNENKRNERRYKAPSMAPPPPPIPKRRQSEHEYASTGPSQVYGLLTSPSLDSKSGHPRRPWRDSPDHHSSTLGIDFKKITIGLGLFCLFLLALLIGLAAYSFSGRSKVDSGEMSMTKIMSGHARPSQLIFYDDFDGDSLNMTIWRHDRYLSKDGFVLFGSSRNNSYTENGILFLKPTFTLDLFDYTFLMKGTLKVGTTVDQEQGCSSFIQSECEKTAMSYDNILNPIMSASLRTSQSFTFTYGIIEMRAKMPKGDWISTEISLQPKFNFYGEPPPIKDKIVLITTRGNSEYISYSNRTNYGNERVCSQLIYTDSEAATGGTTPVVTEFCTNTQPGKGFGEEFHIFRYEWTPDFLKIFIDDKMAGKFVVLADTFLRTSTNVRHVAVHGGEEEPNRKISFDQQFYLQVKLSVAEGFPDTGFRAAYTKPWTNDPLVAGQAPYRFWSNRNRWQRSWLNESSCLQVDYIRVKAL